MVGPSTDVVGVGNAIVDVIADLHLYYVEGVDVPTEEDFATEAE